MDDLTKMIEWLIWKFLQRGRDKVNRPSFCKEKRGVSPDRLHHLEVRHYKWRSVFIQPGGWARQLLECFAKERPVSKHQLAQIHLVEHCSRNIVAFPRTVIRHYGFFDSWQEP